MVLKLYIDYRGTPSRSLLKFLKTTTIPYEVVFVDVIKGHTRKPEFYNTFPLKKVPALVDGDLIMAESTAIFSYLVNKFPGQFPDYWYPADLKKRAKIDEYLAFHHMGMRLPFEKAVVVTACIPPETGQKADEKEVAQLVKDCNAALDIFEFAYLRDNDYIVGNEFSFADLFVANELVDTLITGVDYFEARPKVKAYVERVRARLNPTFDELDKEFYKWKDNVEAFRKSLGK